MASNRERINQLKTEITNAQAQLKSVEETLSKYSNLDSSLQQYKERATATQASIETISKSITEIEQSVQIDAESVSSVKVTAGKLEESIKSTAENIDGVYDSLFGEKDSEGKRTGGLYTDIKKRLEEIDTKRTEQDEDFQKLYEKVESLLPGATSAGLAKAYADQKATYAKPEFIWSIVTVFAMVGITGLGYITFLDATEVTNVTEAFALLVIRLPIFVGVTWLAIYAGKQQSQSGRLRQEYAHKETMARSLEGYKREIESLADIDNPVLNKFMQNAVESVAFNPSSTLDKKHENKPPYIDEISETLNGGMEKVTGTVKTTIEKVVKPETVSKVKTKKSGE